MESKDCKPTTIVIFGRTGSGKSSLGNKLAGKPIFGIGHTLSSQTSETISKVVTLADYPSIRVLLIDTPGFADNRPDMTNENLLANILSFLKDLGEGFHIGIYCISAKTRIDSHDIEEIRLLGTLLGQPVFKNTFIAVTQMNTLEKTTKREMYCKFPVDLPKILNDHGILGFDHKKILFSDFDDFNNKFAKPLTDIMKNAPMYRPQISQEIDVNDPDSIKRFLATPEMQAVMKQYERMLEKQAQEMIGLKNEIVRRSEENRLLIEKNKEDQEIYKGQLNYMNDRISKAASMNERLQKDYSEYRAQQEKELARVNQELQQQQQQKAQFQNLIEQKERELTGLASRIDELERTREAAIQEARNQQSEGDNGLKSLLFGVLTKVTHGIIDRVLSKSWD